MYKTFIILFLSMFQVVTSQPSTPQEVLSKKTSTTSYFVGELGAAWQFPSDHLPVGASVGNIHFALWNILNTEYLHWIEKNEQGLKDSLILDRNVPLSVNSIVTVREDMVIQYIMKMLLHPNYPRSVLALQEVSDNVFRELSLRLPDHLRIIPGDADEQKIQDIFIVDTRIFNILDSKIFKYTCTDNTIIKLSLQEKETGLTYCFIQSHVPGGPKNSRPARIEFANKVLHEYNPETISIILGDMNRSANYFLAHFKEAAAEKGLAIQPFTHLEIPYPTHIDTHLEAVWIDNIFIAHSYAHIKSHVAKDGSELFEELQPTLDLLHRFL